MKPQRLLLFLIFMLLASCTIVIPNGYAIVTATPVTATATLEPSNTASATSSPSLTASPASATASLTATVSSTASQTASATASATQSIVTARTTVRLNLRSGPGTNFSIIDVLDAQATITLYGRIISSAWLFTGQGWVSAQYLIILSGSVSSLPIQEFEEATPTREVLINRVSYNINGEGTPNSASLREHLLELCPSTLLIMNNIGLANELYWLLRPCNTIVIHRTHSALEGGEWFYRSSQNFVDQWKREGFPHIVRYSANEPSFGGAQSVEAFVAHSVELMRLARQNGFTVAVGNFAVGTIRSEDIAAGKYDPFLEAISRYDHYLALHEYTCCVLAFGVGQWPVNFLLDRNRVQPNLWPRAENLPTAFMPNAAYIAAAFEPGAEMFGVEQLYAQLGFSAQTAQGVYPPYWHLRRGDWFLLRADVRGIERPLIILTEFSWDSLADIKPFIEPLRSQFGLSQYFYDMRGVSSYQRLWAWYWPTWSFAKAACEQIKWAESIYPKEYIGLQLFTWTSSSLWLQYDFSGNHNPAMLEFHDCIAA